MDKNQVSELIRRNGKGQDIRCFLISEDKAKDKSHMCSINNYIYTDKEIKVYMDRFHFEEHQKILTKFPSCKLLINKDEKNQTVTVTVFCKFTKVENQFIYIRPFSVEYLDDEDKKASYKISAN